MVEILSAHEARRIALAAQGFGRPRPAQPGKRHLLSTIEALGVVQIDSVNVVSRSHYLPFFSRLGPYDRAVLEDLAWGRKPALAEYWAHEASLTPLATHPLLRWRMQDARDGAGVWKNVASFLRSHADFIDEALRAVDQRGPLAASDLELGAKGAGGWWGWSEGKRAMECLFWTGRLTTATRRGAFERVYDLPERVLPKAIHETPTPERGEACRGLLKIAARAMGVATERDLRDYFRLNLADAREGVAALAAEGALLPVNVKGWDQPAYLWPEARRPRAIKTAALLSPFDNLIWFRERAERLFDVRVRLEIYTPAHKRIHGYYVLPFLQNEQITARVDLKADRKTGRLLVLAAHAERHADTETPGALAAELALMARWLGLRAVEVRSVGDLAPAVGLAVGSHAEGGSTGL
ncbi:winged helix-turn-helix domain-containing protein [Caulobacter sp. BE264]|uniref:winged helix-turn-helix domain-containing protein n=1 Tax=Caulobacter sp. BE264 TaxID=2817724 RepID=UPI00286B2B2D|nr:winged helix-turn-helix domain-containing protein [Caulobacter sp. BE264]